MLFMQYIKPYFWSIDNRVKSDIMQPVNNKTVQKCTERKVLFMITEMRAIDIVPEWRRVVSPEKLFLNGNQVSFFNDMLTWFINRCLLNEIWLNEPETVLAHFTSGSLSAAECLSVFNHFELYVNLAGCDFGYSGSSSDGCWLIGVNG